MLWLTEPEENKKKKQCWIKKKFLLLMNRAESYSNIGLAYLSCRMNSLSRENNFGIRYLYKTIKKESKVISLSTELKKNIFQITFIDTTTTQ